MENLENTYPSANNQRVGAGLAQINRIESPVVLDPRGYRVFQSRLRLHLLAHLKCELFLSDDEIIIRCHDLLGNFRERPLKRSEFSQVLFTGHLWERFMSLNFQYRNSYQVYHLPYLFSPGDAFAIQQAFMFMRTY